MKKIVSLILVMMIAMAVLFAVEYIPVEDNPRIKYKGYTIEAFDKTTDSIIPFVQNEITIDFSSAYNDLYDIVIDQPESSSLLQRYKYFKSQPTTITTKYEDPIKLRACFIRDSDSEHVWYKDIEVPCKLPKDITSNFRDEIDLKVYSGDPDFGAFADTEVYMSIPRRGDFMYDSIYVESIDGTPVYFEMYPERNYDEFFYKILPSYLIENNGVYETKYRAKPGKYVFYGILNKGQDIIIKEFEVFE